MKHPLSLLASLAALALPAFIQAATIDLLASQDGYRMYAVNGGGYIGTVWDSEEVHVGRNRVPTAQIKEYASIRFDLDRLGPAITPEDIRSVTLKLNITEAFSRWGHDPFAYVQIEGYGDTRRYITAGQLGWNAYDFTDSVKAALAANENTLWFSGSPYGNEDGGYSFTSLENFTGPGHISQGPYLHLSTVPLPVSGWLMLSGLAVLAGIGQRYRV